MSLVDNLQAATSTERCRPQCSLANLTNEETVHLRSARDRGTTYRVLAEVLRGDDDGRFPTVKYFTVARHLRHDCSCGESA